VLGVADSKESSLKLGKVNKGATVDKMMYQ